jgi:hypothetical protein
MGQLLNHRHENFCQAFVRGPKAGNIGASYEAAGYSANRGNASRLAAEPQIEKRIAELIAEDQADDREVREKDERIRNEAVLAEFGKIGFANMFDYLSVDDDGRLQVDLARLERDKGAAVRDFQIDYADSEAGRGALKTVRIRLYDKRAALANLAHCLGMIADGRVRGLAGRTAPMDPDVRDLNDMTALEREEYWVAHFAEFVARGVDLQGLLDRAIAEGKIKLSSNAKPMRDIETLLDAVNRNRKDIGLPPVKRLADLHA